MVFPWSTKLVGFYSCLVPSTEGYWQIQTNFDSRVRAEDPVIQGGVQPDSTVLVWF